MSALPPKADMFIVEIDVFAEGYGRRHVNNDVTDEIAIAVDWSAAEGWNLPSPTPPIWGQCCRKLRDERRAGNNRSGPRGQGLHRRCTIIRHRAKRLQCLIAESSRRPLEIGGDMSAEIRTTIFCAAAVAESARPSLRAPDVRALHPPRAHHCGNHGRSHRAPRREKSLQAHVMGRPAGALRRASQREKQLGAWISPAAALPRHRQRRLQHRAQARLHRDACTHSLHRPTRHPRANLTETPDRAGGGRHKQTSPNVRYWG